MQNMFYNPTMDPIVRPFTINTPSLQNIYGTHMQSVVGQNMQSTPMGGAQN